MIFSYFYFLLLALKFCHGTDPLCKYIKTFAIPSISSLRPCSIPRCVFNEANLAVPVKFLVSLYGMWLPSLSKYFFASPKSIKKSFDDLFPVPTTKLSGFMSRWRKALVWINSILSIIWYPMRRVVLRSSFFPHVLKSYSKDFPQRSITITLYYPYVPQK